MQTIPLEIMRIPDGFYVYDSSLYRYSEDLSWAGSHSMEIDVQKYELVLYHFESKRCFNITFKRIFNGKPKKVKIIEYVPSDNEKLDLVNELEVFQEDANHQQKKMSFFLKRKMNKFHEEMKLKYNLNK